MTRETLAAAFPPPLSVGEKDAQLPVWPIFRQELTSTELAGYVFESIDLAPIPGFSGTPFNLLVALSAKGEFMSVQVLSQHEPVFLEGLGPEPLLKFVEQYQGLSLKQNIKIGAGRNEAGGANVYIHGVSKATASVRILNQSLLASALKVARAKLGYAQGRDPDLVARIKPDVMDTLDWAAMLSKGLAAQQRFLNRDVDKAFAGTSVADTDPEARSAPDETFATLYAAPLHVPSVGRNLLSARDWDYLQGRLEPGDSALLVLTQGRYSMLGDEFVRGAVPTRITLRQGDLPIELRDMDIDLFEPLKLPPELAEAEWKIFRVIAPAGLDPALPMQFSLRVIRTRGVMYGDKEERDLSVTLELPDRYFTAAQGDNKTWVSIWKDRWAELVVLLAGLALLTWVLLKPEWLTQSPKRLQRFRLIFLVYTLGFVGWYAQGQLSIVNITGVVRAVVERRSLSFFLYDPMTVLLWAYVLMTFLIWGRGTFCGWLCPFGALQELLAHLGRWLRLPQWRLSAHWDARFKRLKYLVLVGILASALVSVGWTDRLVEVEPFKTSITLMFVRGAPFLLWAVGLLALNLVLYKGFCRYLCPLGAAMAVLGRLRRFDWIARRVECGQPCQRCTHDCRYQAIARSGRVQYSECFQCMDCVVIERSDDLCVPRLQARKSSHRVIPISSVSAS
ncbi:MAG: regulatory protein NosR [Rhodoferax sp.]